MTIFELIVPNNTRLVVSALGLLDGERLLMRRKVFDSECGDEIGAIDYRPNCCRIYLGNCDGETQANTGNPIMFDTTPTGTDMAGVYEFVPDGVLADPANVLLNYEILK